MSPAAPIPAGWLRAADIARRVLLPAGFARQVMKAGRVEVVARGRQRYADPGAVARLYIREQAAWSKSRARVAEAAGLPAPRLPKQPAVDREPRCVLDVTAYPAHERKFVLATLRLPRCPTSPEDATRYVESFLAAKRDLAADSKKGAGRGRPCKYTARVPNGDMGDDEE